ncbi:MAG: cytochrome c biogenesis protein CcsA [Gemmatimonadota bacterium]|nr:cytochrome c biogenesis protein CcsA [Gemmatimonadota bacterium]
MAGTSSRFRLSPLGVICMIGVVLSLYLALVWAPRERVMGDIQRIMYFHVATAWIAELAFVLVGLSSVIYLWLRERRWDIVAHASAEVGFVFCCFVMVTGPIWGKPVWGTWWTWDPRLTFSMILWLIYVAYLMLRAYGGEMAQVKRFLAVLGILGTLDIPFLHFATMWWRGLHPESLTMTPDGFGAGMEQEMLTAMLVAAVTFTLLFFYLLGRRMTLERMRDEVENLQERVDDIGSLAH